MAREKDGYRENIALLNKRYPGKDMLNIAEVAEFIGCSERTARRNIRFNPVTGRVTKSDLARQVSI